jgi:hypothetical protein
VALGFAACGGESRDSKDASIVGACDVHADCIVVPKSCCGSCGAATPDDSIAVSVKGRDTYQRAACEGVGGCPACAVLVEDPRLLGVCVGKRCEVIRLHDHPTTRCADDTDCEIRTRDCCPCGGETRPGRLIALRKDAMSAYADLACEPDQGCPECAPIYPPEVTARCGASAHCEAIDTRLP